MAQFSNCWYINEGATLNTVASTYVGPLVEIITGPTDRALISEIGLVNKQTGVGVNVGIGIPAAQGVGPIPLPLAHAAYWVDQQQSSLIIANMWSGKPPTAPTKYLRRATFGHAAAGEPSTVFKFPRGLVLAPSSSLVLFKIGAGGGNASSWEFWVEWDV